MRAGVVLKGGDHPLLRFDRREARQAGALQELQCRSPLTRLATVGTASRCGFSVGPAIVAHVAMRGAGLTADRAGDGVGRRLEEFLDAIAIVRDVNGGAAPRGERTAGDGRHAGRALELARARARRARTG